MPSYEVRLVGTINDVIEVEAENEDDALVAAYEAWRYTEYEDLEAIEASVKEVER